MLFFVSECNCCDDPFRTKSRDIYQKAVADATGIQATTQPAIRLWTRARSFSITFKYIFQAHIYIHIHIFSSSHAKRLARDVNKANYVYFFKTNIIKKNASYTLSDTHVHTHKYIRDTHTIMSKGIHNHEIIIFYPTQVNQRYPFKATKSVRHHALCGEILRGEIRAFSFISRLCYLNICEPVEVCEVSGLV